MDSPYWKAHPSGAQIQCTTGQYTQVDQQKKKMHAGSTRPRSAAAPIKTA